MSNENVNDQIIADIKAWIAVRLQAVGTPETWLKYICAAGTSISSSTFSTLASKPTLRSFSTFQPLMHCSSGATRLGWYSVLGESNSAQISKNEHVGQFPGQPMPSRLLDLGNPKKVIEHLRAIVDGNAIDAIQSEMTAQVTNLYKLSLLHFKFADKQKSKDWRQRVSRLYYAAYAASRATRLHVYGQFSVEVQDHKKIGELPQDFPNRAIFSNKLDVLREDRNTCDYDQAAALSDLTSRPVESTELVKEYIIETKRYLEARGLALKGNP